MKIETRTLESVRNDIKTLCGLDIGSSLSLGKTFQMWNAMWQVNACYYGDIKGYEVTWCIEVLKGEYGHQVYRVNVRR